MMGTIAFEPGSIFPESMPEVSLERIHCEPFIIDCRELRWWFCEPSVGSGRAWGIYDGGTLSCASRITGVRKALIHGLEGVELDVDEWSREDGMRPGLWKLYGCLTEDVVRWLAVGYSTPGEYRFKTFLDDGFDTDWGDDTRRIGLTPDISEDADGNLRVPGIGENITAGVGFHKVTIGGKGKEFTAMRVLSIDTAMGEHGILTEAYIDKDGTTVFWRRYNGRSWGNGKPWDERMPLSAKLRVNGATYVHWYDVLTDRALNRS